MTHLSRPTHGFSNSRFGTKVLNRIQTRIEDRYLSDRIQIHNGETLPALMAMRRRLHRNGIVSITLGTQASRLIERPFLNGTIRIPTGPVELAKLTDSVILPVYTVREGYWDYSTHIGAPMTSAKESPEDAATAFAAWLEPVVRARPAHWRSWKMVEAPDPPVRSRTTQGRRTASLTRTVCGIPGCYLGRTTVSITWTTPFDAATSAEMTFALSTFTPLVASTESLPPCTVLTIAVLPAMSPDMILPGTT